MDREKLNKLNSPIKLDKEYFLHPLQGLEMLKLMDQQRNLFRDRLIRQEYWWLAQRLKPNTTVIDLGANIGDSAIYFAQFREAKTVIAYEPAPFAYEQMCFYINLGPFKHKIKPKNLAVSSSIKRLKVSMNRRDVIGFDAEHHGDTEGKTVKAITLQEVLDSVTGPVAIKCDIEGAEETIFDNCDMRKVYAVMLEWHGQKRRLGAKAGLLRNGFKVVKNVATGGNGGIMCAEKRK